MFCPTLDKHSSDMTRHSRSAKSVLAFFFQPRLWRRQDAFFVSRTNLRYSYSTLGKQSFELSGGVCAVKMSTMVCSHTAILAQNLTWQAHDAKKEGRSYLGIRHHHPFILFHFYPNQQLCKQTKTKIKNPRRTSSRYMKLNIHQKFPISSRTASTTSIYRESPPNIQTPDAPCIIGMDAIPMARRWSALQSMASLVLMFQGFNHRSKARKIFPLAMFPAASGAKEGGDTTPQRAAKAGPAALFLWRMLLVAFGARASK